MITNDIDHTPITNETPATSEQSNPTKFEQSYPTIDIKNSQEKTPFIISQ